MRRAQLNTGSIQSLQWSNAGKLDIPNSSEDILLRGALRDHTE